MSKKIIILFLEANPLDTSRLQLGKEVKRIKQKLRESNFRDMFELISEPAVCASDLQGILLRHNPDIVHFSGHCSEISELILEDDVGTANPIAEYEISELFKIHKGNIKCVLLNACYTQKQAESIAKYIDCVIAMSSVVDDDAAIAFAATFYEALANGKDIKTAFKAGSLEIELEKHGKLNRPIILASKSRQENIIFINKLHTIMEKY